MATLLHGPRLGSPSSGGFTVWLHFDGAATIELQTRRTGTTAWSTQDTQAVETTKHNTVTLTATGLDAATKYDYRIMEGTTEHASYNTRTMPLDQSGRFVVYFCADAHDVDARVAEASTVILSDWQTNYDTIGVPGVFAWIGDFSLYLGSDTGDADDKADTTLGLFDDLGDLPKYMPMLYMWDDWDFGGNNSSYDQCASFAGTYSGTAVDEARKVWDYLWRDLPRPASPSYGYIIPICGVPIIVADSRSQKRHGDSYTPTLRGTESEPCWGTAQSAWLKTQLETYCESALVVFISTHTFRSARAYMRVPLQPTAVRDSLGIFHRNEQCDVFSSAVRCGYGWRRNLAVISGDDHRTVTWLHDDICPGHRDAWDTAYRVGVGIGLNFAEFKVVTGQGGGTGVGAASSIFGSSIATGSDPSNVAFEGEIGGSTLRVDVSAYDSGKHVEARFSYVITYATGSQAQGDILVDRFSRTGDFWFRDGTWETYTGSNATQYYPSDEGPGKLTFEETYTDTILGTVHKRADSTRNTTGQIRRSDDPEADDRDDILNQWRFPTEDTREDEP